MVKVKAPGFIDYAYANLHFWIVVGLWGIFSMDYESLSVGEFTGTVLAVTFFVTVFYFFSWLLTKSALKKINKK